MCNRQGHNRFLRTLLRGVCGLVWLFVSVTIGLAQDDALTPTPDPIAILTETQTPTPTVIPTIDPSTPTPTLTPRPQVAAFIFTWDEEMIYPQAVRFTLTVSRPINEIASLLLAIDSTSANPREVVLTPASVVTRSAETFTDFTFLWQVPATDPLPFQEAIDYTWLVTLVDGQTALVPGAFLFGLEDLTWVESTDPDGLLNLLYPQGAILPDTIRAQFPQLYTTLSANTGLQPRFNFVLFSREVPFDPCFSETAETVILLGPKTNVEVPCITPVINGILNQLGYEQFQLETLTTANARDRILVEVINRFYAPIWEGRDVPAWFQTGLTYFYLPGQKLGQLENVRRNYRLQEPYTLAEMATRDVANPTLWESQSYSMVLYIANRIGTQALYDLARTAGTEGESFAASYENAVGQPIEALLPTWRNWIYSDGAVADANLNLYQGETPIPSATATITPFPPSETPTATDTFTPTATATPAGFRPTATPIPTFTPSMTPTPEPPTITPRPAGFREANPPTSVPSVPPSAIEPSEDEGIDVLFIGVLGLFVVLGLLLGYLFLSTSRN